MLFDISDTIAAPGRKQIRLLTPTDSITELTVLLHAAYAGIGGMGLNYTTVDQPEEVTRERVLRGDCARFSPAICRRGAGTTARLTPFSGRLDTFHPS